jgi:hypothetical protein
MKISDLNDRQRRALLLDERAIEELDFRDRDELIAEGIAIRRWPAEVANGFWRTWLTPTGHAVRQQLARQHGFGTDQ